jgi:hypothetical protein
VGKPRPVFFKWAYWICCLRGLRFKIAERRTTNSPDCSKGGRMGQAALSGRARSSLGGGRDSSLAGPGPIAGTLTDRGCRIHEPPTPSPPPPTCHDCFSRRTGCRGRGERPPSSTNPSPHARSGGKEINASSGGRGRGGGQKASLRLAGATPGRSLKRPTLGAGQLAESRWDLILWKPLPPEMEHTLSGLALTFL